MTETLSRILLEAGWGRRPGPAGAAAADPRRLSAPPRRRAAHDSMIKRGRTWADSAPACQAAPPARPARPAPGPRRGKRLGKKRSRAALRNETRAEADWKSRAETARGCPAPARPDPLRPGPTSAVGSSMSHHRRGSSGLSGLSRTQAGRVGGAPGGLVHAAARDASCRPAGRGGVGVHAPVANPFTGQSAFTLRAAHLIGIARQPLTRKPISARDIWVPRSDWWIPRRSRPHSAE